MGQGHQGGRIINGNHFSIIVVRVGITGRLQPILSSCHGEFLLGNRGAINSLAMLFLLFFVCGNWGELEVEVGDGKMR